MHGHIIENLHEIYFFPISAAGTTAFHSSTRLRVAHGDEKRASSLVSTENCRLPTGLSLGKKVFSTGFCRQKVHPIPRNSTTIVSQNSGKILSCGVVAVINGWGFNNSVKGCRVFSTKHVYICILCPM